jgi:hypothetical protein
MNTRRDPLVESIVRNARARGGTVNIRELRKAHADMPAPVFYRAIEQLQADGTITLGVRPA